MRLGQDVNSFKLKEVTREFLEFLAEVLLLNMFEYANWALRLHKILEGLNVPSPNSPSSITLGFELFQSLRLFQDLVPKLIFYFFD